MPHCLKTARTTEFDTSKVLLSRNQGQCMRKSLMTCQTRSTPQRRQAAQRPHILCSICFHSFGALVKDVRLFIASLRNQPIYHKMCSIGIFVNLEPLGLNLKRVLFDPQLGGQMALGSGMKLPLRREAKTLRKFDRKQLLTSKSQYGIRTHGNDGEGR